MLMARCTFSKSSGAARNRCGGSELGESALHSRKPWCSRAEGLGVLGCAGGRLAKFLEWRISELQVNDVPKPSFGILEAGKLPRFPTPLYRAHHTPCEAGEQIPKVRAIMLLISGNVHRASLKQSELI
jgi:hypothetical protein